MKAFYVIVGTAAALWLLTEARNVLQPAIIAVFLWFMLKATAKTYARLVYGKGAEPTRLVTGLSAISFITVFVFVAAMIADKSQQIRASLPIYEENLDQIISAVFARFGMSPSLGVGEMIAQVDLSRAALTVAGTAASYLTSAIVIVFYVIFIFAEDGVAERKLGVLIGESDRRDEVKRVIAKINHEIEVYLGIKLVLGIVQALPTFIVLSLVGVDAPEFWAAVVFFFSFIPTVGSLVGIIFPSLMALVQFEEITPFLVVAGCLGTVQVLASNFLEPRLMGSSMNLSPLAIFFAIFAGGSVWGIVGALIVVPLLAITAIICARIEAVRPVAVLLSRDGKIFSD